MPTMPKLPVEEMVLGLTAEDARIVRAAFNSRNGCLRASKPFKDADCFAGKDDAAFKGDANYVWRMLCFDFVASHPHSCMPVCADLGISFAIADREGRYDKVRARTKELDALVKRIESALPVTAQAGAMRWARAFGVI